ncbi:hypothetical protein J4407_02840 [Candidatus Pacearchaeota archaeon]|nr:hypothetical protein [Candidatus Pacearchaeota archaeon]
MITDEDLEVYHSYLKRHPNKKKVLFPPSKRMFREYKLKTGDMSLARYWTEVIADCIGLGGIVRYLSLQDYDDEIEGSTYRAIFMTDYGR